MGCDRPSQSFQSPTTLTRRAFGAHTAKMTPATPSMIRGRSKSERVDGKRYGSSISVTRPARSRTSSR